MKLPRPGRRIWILAGAATIVAVLVAYMSRPKPAEVISPVQRDVVELVVATGKLRAVRESLVGAETAGLVESLDVSEGTAVRKGQLLGRLRLGETDARLTQTMAALDGAEQTLRAEEAALAKAKRDLARLVELEKRHLVSKSDLDRAEADNDVQEAKTAAARARLREARADVERVRPEFTKREIRAPFDGVVVKRLVEPGVSVNPATSWFSIAEMGATEIYVETDENNLGKLKVGQDAIAVSPAYPDRPFPARVTQIGPNVDYDRGVVGVRLVPAELPPFALPNMTVDVNIEVRRASRGLALPVSAVAVGAPAPYVLEVQADGRLATRPVVIVGRNPEWVAVEGLEPTMRVVNEITQFRAGGRVRPVAAGEGGERPRRPGAGRPR